MDCRCRTFKKQKRFHVFVAKMIYKITKKLFRTDCDFFKRRWFSLLKGESIPFPTPLQSTIRESLLNYVFFGPKKPNVGEGMDSPFKCAFLKVQGAGDGVLVGIVDIVSSSVSSDVISVRRVRILTLAPPHVFFLTLAF